MSDQTPSKSKQRTFFDALRGNGILTNEINYSLFSEKMKDPAIRENFYNELVKNEYVSDGLYEDFENSVLKTKEGLTPFTNEGSPIDATFAIMTTPFRAIFGSDSAHNVVADTYNRVEMAAVKARENMSNIFNYGGLTLQKNRLQGYKYRVPEESRKQNEKLLNYVDKELHNVNADIKNTAWAVQREYEKEGLIDPTVTSPWITAFESVPQTLIGLGLSIIPGAGVPLSGSFFGLTSMAETSADFYSFTAKKDKDGNIIPGTGSLEDAGIGGAFGLPAGLVEVIGGPERFARGLFTKQARKKMYGYFTNLTGKKLQKGAMSAGKRTLLSSFEEGSEEVGQGFIIQSGEKFIDQRDEYDYGQIATGFYHGAVGGFQFGSVMSAYQYASEKSNMKKIHSNAKSQKERIKKGVESGVITPKSGKEVIKIYDEIEKIDNPVDMALAIDQLNDASKEVQNDVDKISKVSEAIMDNYDNNLDQVLNQIIGTGSKKVLYSFIEGQEIFKEEYNKTDKNLSEEERNAQAHKIIYEKNPANYSYFAGVLAKNLNESEIVEEDKALDKMIKEESLLGDLAEELEEDLFSLDDVLFHPEDPRGLGRLAFLDSDKNIHIIEGTTPETLFNYLTGKPDAEGNISETSKQKQLVMKELEKRGVTEEKLMDMIDDNSKVVQFLVAHEKDHLRNHENDLVVYSKDKKNLTSKDKIEVEVRATLSAIEHIKEYNASQGSVFFQETEQSDFEKFQSELNKPSKKSKPREGGWNYPEWYSDVQKEVTRKLSKYRKNKKKPPEFTNGLQLSSKYGKIMNSIVSEINNKYGYEGKNIVAVGNGGIVWTPDAKNAPSDNIPTDVYEAQTAEIEANRQAEIDEVMKDITQIFTTQRQIKRLLEEAGLGWLYRTDILIDVVEKDSKHLKSRGTTSRGVHVKGTILGDIIYLTKNETLEVIVHEFLHNKFDKSLEGARASEKAKSLFRIIGNLAKEGSWLKRASEAYSHPDYTASAEELIILYLTSPQFNIPKKIADKIEKLISESGILTETQVQQIKDLNMEKKVDYKPSQEQEIKEINKKYDKQLKSIEESEIFSQEDRSEVESSLENASSSSLIETIKNKDKVPTSTSIDLKQSNTVSDLNANLKSMNLENPSISSFADFVFGLSKSIKVKFIEDIESIGERTNARGEKVGISLGNRPGAYNHSNKTIYMNATKLRSGSDWVYNTLTHESIHAVITKELSDNPTFKKEIGAIYDEALKDSSFHLKVNAFDRNSVMPRNNSPEEKERAMNEFVAYMMSDTSSISNWARETEMSPKTSFMKRFVDKVKELFYLLSGNKKNATYWNAMELTFAKTFDVKNSYSDMMKEKTSQFEKERSDDSFDTIDLMETEQIGAIDIKNIVERLNPNTYDVYEYIQSLNFTQLMSAISENESIMKSFRANYSKNSYNMPFEKFLKKTVIKLYNSAKSLEEHPVIRLNVNYEFSKKSKTGREFINSEVEELSKRYYDKNNNEQSSYKPKIRLSQRVQDLSTILGVELEMVFIDDIKINTFSGKKLYSSEWKSISKEDPMMHQRNEYYGQLLKANNIFFPGSFADKNTLVGFRTKSGIKLENAPNFKKVTSDYGDKIRALIDSGVIPEGQIKNYLQRDFAFDILRESYVLRLLIEDLKLGAVINENGFNSVLFNPESKDTYDALKIFKRATEVSPLNTILLDKDENSRIYDSLNDKTGIILEDDGSLSFNAMILDSDSSETIEFVFNGEEVEVSLGDLLKNDNGVETLDGVNLHTGNWGEVIHELTGEFKNGPKKGKILNQPRNMPFYDKGAFHLTKSEVLKKWMHDNNVALIVSDTSSKINTNKKSKIFGEVNVVKMPFSDYYTDSAKDIARDDAKGLTQSLTSNYTADSNKAYESRKDALKTALSKLSSNFVESMRNLDPVKVIDDVRRTMLEGASKQQTTINQILIDHIYEVVGTDVVKRISDEQIATELSGLFSEPLIASTLKSYIKKEVNKNLSFRIPSSWMTLRPDLGWLEPNIINIVFNTTRNEVKTDVKNESRELYSNLNEANDKLKNATEENSEEINKEIKSIENKIKKLEEITDKEVSDRAMIKFKQRIDMKSGRLKEGWAYVSSDINSVKGPGGNNTFDLKVGDYVIATNIPSSDVTSQSAPKIAGILPSTQVDQGIATLHSDYVQTIAGKDFDIDQILLTPFTRKYFTKSQYQNFVDSVNKTNLNFRNESLKLYRKILEEPSLSFTADENHRSIYDSKVQTEFMQKVFGQYGESGKELFNPFYHNLSLANDFTKEIGQIANDNKFFTMQAQIGYKAEIEILGKKRIIDATDGISKWSIISSRLLHDNVDKPTNINSFFYSMNTLQKYDIIYNLGLEVEMKEKGLKYSDDPADLNEEELKIFRSIQAIRKTNSQMFKYGAKFSSSYNLDNKGDLRGLDEDLKYIKTQKYIVELLERKENLALGNFLINKNSTEEEIEIYNSATIRDVNKSEILRSIKEIDLSLIPEININLSDYTSWQKRIYQNLMKNELYKEQQNRVKKQYKEYIKDFESKKRVKDGDQINISANRYLFDQFLTTLFNDNTDLHLFKVTLITLMNPTQQSSALKYKDEYYRNVFDRANDYSFPRLFESSMQRRTIKSNKTNKSTVTSPNGTKIDLRIVDNGLNISFKFKDKDYSWGSQQLLNDNTKIGLHIKNLLIGENSLFSDASFEDDATGSRNRYSLSQLFTFSGNTDYNDRIKFSLDFVNQYIEQFTEAEKDVFWRSLVGYPKGRITLPLNLIPSTAQKFDSKTFPTQSLLLELASKVDDPSGKRFVDQYVKSATVTHDKRLGFDRVMKIKTAINEAGMTTDSEIYFQDSESERDLMRETASFVDQFKTGFGIAKKYKKFRNIKDNVVGQTVSLLSGKIIDVTKMDVTQKARSIYATEVEANSVSQEDIAITKQAILREGFAPFVERMERVLSSNEMNIEALQENLKMSKEDLNSEINLLSENLGFRVDITEKNKEFVYKIRNKESADLDYLLKENGIEDLNERMKYKTAIGWRTLYDYITPKISNNALNYMEYLSGNLNENFGNKILLTSLVKKWKNLITEFSANKGTYFPRVYDEKTAEQLSQEWGAYQLLRKQNPDATRKQIMDKIHEALLNDDFVQEASEYSLVVDKHNGKTYSWQMKRKFPNWFVKGRYETRSNNIHKNHQEQLYSALMSDINFIEWLMYDFKASQENKPMDLRNAMKGWFGLISNNDTFKSAKVPLRKIKKGDGVSFYYKMRNKDVHYKGIVKNITDNYIYLMLDENQHRIYLQSQLGKYRNLNEKIKNNSISFFKEATVKQKITLRDLTDENYQGLTIAEASELIIKELEEQLNDESSWGRFRKDDINIKQNHNGKTLNMNGIERLNTMPLLTSEGQKNFDNIIRGTQALSSVTALGSPSSGARNSAEALWQTIQIVGIRNFLLPSVNEDSKYYKYLRLLSGKKGTIKDPIKFFANFKTQTREGDYESYSKSIRKLSELGTIESIDPHSKDPNTMSRVDALEAIVSKYLYSHGLGRHGAVDSEDSFDTDPTSMIKKAGKFGRDKLMTFFRYAEESNRIMGAYLFGYKAIFIDGVTNVRKIEESIRTGVAKANSLYEAEYRKLIESNALGSFGSQFSQFSTFQLDVKTLEMDQAKRLGQWKPIWEPLKELNIVEAYRSGKFNLKNIFSSEITAVGEDGIERTYKRGNSVDPIIPYEIGKKFLLDTAVGLPLEMMYPGLRVGNPINKIFSLGFNIIFQSLLSGDLPDKDDWDMWNYVFLLMGFKLGMGFSIPIQMVKSFAIDEELRMPISFKAGEIGALTLAGLQTDAGPRRNLQRSLYEHRQLMKFLLSVDITPFQSRYQSEFENKVTTSLFPIRPLMYGYEGIKKIIK